MFNILWFENEQAVTSAAFSVGFNNRTSQIKVLSFRSNAVDNLTFENLVNVKFFITGPDASTIKSWATIGGAAKPELNGGVDISFDNGRSYQRFSDTVGNELDSSTWIPLLRSAIGANAIDGKLTPFDTATITLKCVVPPGVPMRVYDIQIVPDCDIL